MYSLLSPLARMPWQQNYDPLHGPLSTIAAALPLVVLLGLLALRRVTAYVAALAGLATALIVAVAIIGMPAPMAGRAALFGAAYGLLPIGWIVLNVIFLYRITEERGVFVTLQRAITGITTDRRLQLLLVAFCFGAFFEGAAGFGTPVAVTGAMLIGIGFPPLEASALSLIANTAPVAFGALGTPIIALQGVTGLDLGHLSAMVGRQLPFFSLIVPFWLIVAYCGWKGMLEVWPAILVAGISFAVPQFLVSNYHGPWLVDIVASASSMLCLGAYLRLARRGRASENAPAGQRPTSSRCRRHRLRAPRARRAVGDRDHSVGDSRDRRIRLGHAAGEGFLNGLSAPSFAIPGLDKMVARVPPVVAKPTPEPAVYVLTWLSATGTAILIAAILAGLMLRYSIGDLVRRYFGTLRVVWPSLLTISAMLALGYTTRYSGEDAILGLAFAHTGVVVPILRRDARLARRGGHGERHVVERAVRKSADDHGEPPRAEPRVDGGGEQLRRRDGEDDRCAEHLRREHGDGLGRTRMANSAIRVLS